MNSPRPLGVRFVESISIDSRCGCWFWTGTLTPRGYPQISVWDEDQWTTQRAHRVAYELLIGPIPEGLTLDHICRVRHCVNPEHLEPVTVGENVRRGDGHCGRNARKTHCIHGHAFTPENTWVSAKTGRRSCRTCGRGSTRRQRERRAA